MGLKRGDIVTVASAGEFGKPRPALIVQGDLALSAGSITYLPITSTLKQVPLIRIAIEPTVQNGLRKSSEIMVDLIQTSTLSRFGGVIGHVEAESLRKVEAAILVFLGLA